MKIMEEIVNFVESPETSTIRLNTDAMSYLSNAYAASKDKDHGIHLLHLITKHSDFVLKTSENVLLKQKMHLSVVK